MELTHNDLPKAMQELLQLSKEMNQRLQALEHFKPEEELLSIEEASEFLKKTKQTLYRYSCKGTIPACRRGGRLYFEKKDLLTWIRDGKKPTESSILEETDRFIIQSSKRKSKY